MSNMDVTNEYYSKVYQMLFSIFQKYEIHLCSTTFFFLLTSPFWQLSPAIQVPSLLPVAIFIEMDWQSNPRPHALEKTTYPTWGGTSRSAEKKSAPKWRSFTKRKRIRSPPPQPIQRPPTQSYRAPQPKTHPDPWMLALKHTTEASRRPQQAHHIMCRCASGPVSELFKTFRYGLAMLNKILVISEYFFFKCILEHVWRVAWE